MCVFVLNIKYISIYRSAMIHAVMPLHVNWPVLPNAPLEFAVKTAK